MTDQDDEKDTPVEPEHEPTSATEILPTEADQDAPGDSMYVVKGDAAAVQTQRSRSAVPAKGPLKPDTLSTDYVVVADRETGTVAPAPTELLTEPRVVYRDAPKPPKPKSNRPLGLLVAVAGTVLFAVFLAFAALITFRNINGYAEMSMLANYGYWIPIAVFLVAFVLVVLVINRGGWWAYIIGSALVAVAVFAGSAAIVALVSITLGYSTTYFEALGSPIAIAAGILSREVSLWAGLLLSRRGRTLTARNAEARAEFDRSQAVATA